MLRFSTKEGDKQVPIAYFDTVETASAALAGLIRIAAGKELIIDDPGYSVELPEEGEITIVYFESGCHADKVAVFATEGQYFECVEGLAKLAAKHRMHVTESVCPEEEDWKEPLWECFQEKLTYEKENGKKGWYTGGKDGK